MQTTIKYTSILRGIARAGRVCVRYKRSDTADPDKDLLKNMIIEDDKIQGESKFKPYERVSTEKKNHPERAKYPNEYEEPFPKGKIFERLPIKIELEAGKKYAWCTCGHSHKQPFCDGAHKSLEGTSFKKTHPKFRPHRFEVEETKAYYLCNCKQTDNRPFCDGTHKTLATPGAPPPATESTT